jgi:hypothetical protein
MGSSSSQTIGYKYFMGVHCGISLPVDAVLEFKAGGRVAWQGEVTASSTIQVCSAATNARAAWSAPST